MYNNQIYIKDLPLLELIVTQTNLILLNSDDLSKRRSFKLRFPLFHALTILFSFLQVVCACILKSINIKKRAHTGIQSSISTNQAGFNHVFKESLVKIDNSCDYPWLDFD